MAASNLDGVNLETVLDSIRVLTHSAVRIERSDGAVVYFDPFQLVEEPHDADVVLVTHDHYDHFSPEDAAKVARAGTVVVAPATCTDGIRAKFSDVEVVPARPGETLEVPVSGSGVPLHIEAVHAYNVETGRLQFHPKENDWLGYVVEVDGARCYVAGDTDQNPDNEHVACDVAIVPIGGTYTMDPTQAAAFVNAIRPKAAVPTHYGSAVGPKDAVDAFAPLVDPAIAVAVKMEWPELG